MNDVSPRRRKAAKFGMAAAALALPLTATVTYAEVIAPSAPPAPASFPGAPTAPLAPVAPTAPLAPEAPLLPLAIQAANQSSEDFDEAMRDIERAEAEIERAERIVEIEEERIEDAEGKHRRHVKIVHKGDKKMTAEERAQLKAEVAEAMEEAKASMREAREATRVALLEVRDSKNGMTSIEMKCDGDQPVSEKTTSDGKRVMRICHTAISAHALSGIREARKAIAADTEMDADIRAQVLQSLDERIAEWEREG